MRASGTKSSFNAVLPCILEIRKPRDLRHEIDTDGRDPQLDDRARPDQITNDVSSVGAEEPIQSFQQRFAFAEVGSTKMRDLLSHADVHDKQAPVRQR